MTLTRPFHTSGWKTILARTLRVRFGCIVHRFQPENARTIVVDCTLYRTYVSAPRRNRTGVAVIWGPPSYGDPHPHIASDMGMGVTISLSDMRFPNVPITLAVWGSSGDMGIPYYS